MYYLKNNLTNINKCYIKNMEENMRKFEKFFNNVATVRSILRGKIAKQVKVQLGDSANNNRTLTVNQTVRFLKENGHISLANQIEKVREVIEPTIKTVRRTNKVNRTDAIDISEFVNVYRTYVMNNKVLRPKVSVALRTR